MNSTLIINIIKLSQSKNLEDKELARVLFDGNRKELISALENCLENPYKGNWHKVYVEAKNEQWKDTLCICALRFINKNSKNILVNI